MFVFLKKFVSILPVLFLAQVMFAQTREEGFAAMQMEKWDKAIEVYQAVVKANPADLDAALSLSNAYLAKGDRAQAIATAKTVEGASDAAISLVASSRVLLLENRIADADAQLERAARKGKRDVVALRHIGESYFFYIAPGDTKPNRTRAADLLKAAYELNAKDFNTLMSLGYVYREMGNGGEAARYYEYASQYQPKNPLPLFMVASIYKAAKLRDKYFENIDAAIALDNSYTPALRDKADYLYARRQWDKAIEAYDMLLKNGKAVVIEDEMQMANCLFLTQKYNECSQLVEKIIAKDGSKNYLRRLLAYSYYETGDYAKGYDIISDYFGKVDAEKIIASDYTYLGRLSLKAKNDTMAAISNLKKAIAVDTAEWQLNGEVAGLYYAKKDFCNAATHYQIRIDSLREMASATDWYKVGTCYINCKQDTMRFQHALAAYTKVTELSPTSASGWYGAANAAYYMEPDLTQDTSQAAVNKFGIAHPYYDKYIEVASADAAKNQKGLAKAWEYQMIYHFFKKEDTDARNAIAELQKLDPANTKAVEILKILDASATAPPNGGPKK